MIALLAAASASAVAIAAIPALAQAFVVGHLRVAIASDATFRSYSWAANHEQVVILQSWDIAELHALKRANPGVKVLMYENASSATTSVAGDGRHATGVSYRQAAANGWLLRNRSGRPFTFQGYSSLYATDVGLRAYQLAWASNVLSELRADPWDGVFIDDINPTIRFHYCVSCVARYPTDAAYSRAMRSFVETVGSRVIAAGRLAIANIGSWPGYTSTVDPWLNWLSGAMDENFVKWGDKARTGYAGPGTWATQLGEVKTTVGRGKLFIGITKSSAGDARAAIFGYATELLAADGDAVFTLGSDGDGSWFPQYAYDIGMPLGAEHAMAGGVHVRRFTRGIVLVNPTYAAATVRLPGVYVGSRSHLVRSVQLGPQTGRVLTRASLVTHPGRSHRATYRSDHRHRWSTPQTR
jgi:hypothetical protein